MGKIYDISIMYHYIRKPELKGIVPLHPKDFKAQLEWITERYEVVSPDDLGKRSGDKPLCVLTFDDATKDQYEVAFDILNRKGLPAYFTVLSGPLAERVVPVMHLVHMVLSYYTDEEIWSDLRTLIHENEVIAKSAEVYSYETYDLRRYNKYVLNFGFTETQSRDFLEPRIISEFGSLHQFIEQFYISVDEFKKMFSAGMTLGVHAVHHRPYFGDGRKFYEAEIDPCRRFMREKLGVQARWYTPAFGGGPGADRMFTELGDVLQEEGFNGAFTIRPGSNDGSNEFWLNRYDCNRIPPVGRF